MALICPAKDSEGSSTNGRALSNNAIRKEIGRMLRRIEALTK